MKKALLLSILLANGLFATAQVYVEGVKLDPIYRTDGSCALRVDYGQAEPRKDFVSDANGKKIDFRSLIDGLNFFYSNGWEVVTTSVVETNRRFLLQRR